MITQLKPQKVKFPKPAVISWDTFKGGLNIFARETEIAPNEMSSATNLILQGIGIPTKRWGSNLGFIAASSTYNGRLLQAAKDANDNIQILALTDWGYLVKQNNASYISLTGASFASGYNVESTQLGNIVYFVSQQQPMVKYDFSILHSFNALTNPTNLKVTNLSSASGANTWSWVVTSTSITGETVGSEISLATLPQQLTQTVMRVSWSGISTASGDLTGYNIYRGAPGNERWIGGVPPSITYFDDAGAPNTSGNFVPVADTTQGLKGRYIVRFQDRLIIAGTPGYPTRVAISGRWNPSTNNQERFDVYAGGTFIDVEPDSGEDITGLGIYYRTQTSTQTVVAFKERSVWEIAIETVQQSNADIPNFPLTVPTYRLLTGSQGATSHRSIVPVENDVMFLNRRGIYVLRYEPNLYNIINANEISVKVRPFFQSLAYADLLGANAVYADKKYIVSFPTTNQSICFDRERLAFTGPWRTPFGTTKWSTYIDSNGSERWLALDYNDNQVQEFKTTLPDDNGTPIVTSFKTKKENFGDWTIFKNLSEVYMNFRNVQGLAMVNIYIEDRTGTVVTAKAFTLTGASSSGTSGMGTDEIGLIELGDTGTSSSATPGEIQKVAVLYKTTRTMQVEIITNHSADYYELLNIKGVATLQARGNRPSKWVA